MSPATFTNAMFRCSFTFIPRANPANRSRTGCQSPIRLTHRQADPHSPHPETLSTVSSGQARTACGSAGCGPFGGTPRR